MANWLDESRFNVHWAQLAEYFRQAAGGSADTEHPDVAPALRFIAQNLSGFLDVNCVVAALPVGRRTLERRFETHLGVSVRRAITLIRLEVARQLLCQTHFTITEVSMEVGFCSPSRMANVFRRELGVSPRMIRRTSCASAGSESDGDPVANETQVRPIVNFSYEASPAPVVAPGEVFRKIVALSEVFDAPGEAAFT